MKKDLLRINQNSKLALNKAKSMIAITDKILLDKNNDWIDRLIIWGQNNIIQERTYFPKTKNELINITKLSLRWNRLKEIPKELFNLTELEILELNNNNLEILPAEISNLINLKELNLNINSLKTLPKEIIELKQLEVLNIKNNKYLELDSEQISWLKELKEKGCKVIYDQYKFNLGE